MKTTPLNSKKAPLILCMALLIAFLPIIQTFATINSSAYQYGVTSCTEGSDLQKERCKDQSAEAMAYRLKKGITGTDPTNPLYSTWVTNFKNNSTNGKPIDFAILLAATTSSSNNQTYLVNLYQNLLCKTAQQEATAIAQWKSQLDGNKQTRAQIALNLAKRPASMDCMRSGFLTFLQTNPPDDPHEPDPTLADISVQCTTQVGQSCSVAAPQYCLSGFVTQPAHGTSTITSGNIIYTPNDSSSAEENYAHLRQNGTATAKCNVKIIFQQVPPTDNGKRFHITFLGVGFNNNQSLYQEKINLYKSGIISQRPFTNYASKIVFHDVNVPDAASASFQCSGGFNGTDPLTRAVKCNEPAIEAWLAQNSIPGDRVQVVRNVSAYGGASNYGGGIVDADGHPYCFGNPPVCTSVLGGGKFSFMNIGSDTGNGASPGNTSLHEFSHSMGLDDEYVYTPGPDEVGDFNYRQGQCVPTDPGTNWRIPLPFNAATWWDEWKDVPDSSDTRANTNWHKGCGYNKFYRPSESSIMSTTVWYYNDISAHLVEQSLKSYLD